MPETLRSILLGTLALDAAFVLALVLTVGRPLPGRDQPERDRVLGPFLLGVGIQCLHVIEEFVTGFHILFPRFLGLAPWSAEFFVAFNLSWITIWVWSPVAVRWGVRAAALPIWFFSIAAVGNGIVHPLLSLATGGYFPGLYTSPVLGVIGVVVGSRLVVATRRTSTVPS